MLTKVHSVNNLNMTRLVPGSSILSSEVVKNHRRISLDIDRKMRSEERRRRYNHSPDYFGDLGAEDRRRLSAKKTSTLTSRFTSPPVQF